MANWEPVQSRSTDQLRTKRGFQKRPAATELARAVVSKWGWRLDPEFGTLKNSSDQVVAGCIEEVADAMVKLGFVTTATDGQISGVNWLTLDESSLVQEIG